MLAAGSAAAGRPAPQCSDGRDNDGDGLVDWRTDPGCTDTRDDSEATRLECRLGHERLGRSYLIEGECSGPFASMTVEPPRGARLDPEVKPDVEEAHRCRSVNGKLLCAMDDGAGNRRHAVRVGFAFIGTPKGPARVRFGDARGRAVPWVPAEQAGGRHDPSADLRIDVSGPVRHVHDPRESNQRIGYYIRVRNAGPGESPGGVVMYDVRGARAGLWDVGAGGWVHRPCTIRLKQCTLGRMPPGATAEILLSVPAPPNSIGSSGPGRVSVTAEAVVRGEAPDPVRLSNSDTATTPVDPPWANLELHLAAEPRRTVLDKLTGVANVRLSALVRNLGPLSLRSGETSLVFRQFGPASGIRLVRTFGDVPCEADPGPEFAVGCELGAVGLGATGFAVSITVSFANPGRYSIQALASAHIGSGGQLRIGDASRLSPIIEVLAPQS